MLFWAIGWGLPLLCVRCSQQPPTFGPITNWVQQWVEKQTLPRDGNMNYYTILRHLTSYNLSPLPTLTSLISAVE